MLHKKLSHYSLILLICIVGQTYGMKRSKKKVKKTVLSAPNLKNPFRSKKVPTKSQSSPTIESRKKYIAEKATQEVSGRNRKNYFSPKKNRWLFSNALKNNDPERINFYTTNYDVKELIEGTNRKETWKKINFNSENLKAFISTLDLHDKKTICEEKRMRDWFSTLFFYGEELEKYEDYLQNGMQKISRHQLIAVNRLLNTGDITSHCPQSYSFLYSKRKTAKQVVESKRNSNN